MKLMQDIYYGKMAEFAVYNWLESLNKKATYPDISIYKPGEGNYFEPDIVCGDIRLHVKSCVAVGTYLNSWTFHLKDGLISKPLDNDFIMFVTIYADRQEFDGYLAQANFITDIYGEPRKQGMEKKVIYEDKLLSKYNSIK